MSEIDRLCFLLFLLPATSTTVSSPVSEGRSSFSESPSSGSSSPPGSSPPLSLIFVVGGFLVLRHDRVPLTRGPWLRCSLLCVRSLITMNCVHDEIVDHPG